MRTSYPETGLADRLTVRERTELFERLSEKSFDRLTRMAVRIFGVESAAIVLCEAGQSWVKSCCGGSVEPAYATAFCSLVLEAGEVAVVEDAQQDERVEPRFLEGSSRFSAGAPLEAAGRCLGAFCLFGAAPGTLSEREAVLLRDLAAQARDEIALRRALPVKADAVYENKTLFAAVVAVQNEIASASLAPEEVMEAVVHRAHVLTHADGAGIARIEGDDLVYYKTAGTERNYDGLRLNIDTTLTGRCMKTGETVYCADTEQDERVNRSVTRKIGIRSMIILPLYAREEIVGVLNVISSEPRAFTEEDVQALSLLADLAGAALERAEAKRALRESEQRYRTLVKQTAEAICFVDPDTLRVFEANSAFRQLLGYSEEEIEALSIYDVVAYERARVDEHARMALAGRPISAERTWRRKDGTQVDVQVTISAVRQERRDVLFVVARNVTEQKRAEAELRRKERRYRSLFERANVLAMIFSPEDETILEANPEACAAYGLTRDELVGHSLKALTADVARGEREVQHIIERGGTHNFESVHYGGDGEQINVLASCSLIDYDGEQAILFFGRNITERKRAEEALRQSKERYRSLLEHLPVGVYRTTPDGRLLEANQAMAELLGYSTVEALQARPVQEHYIEEQDRTRHLDQISPENLCTPAEYRLQRLDGSSVWVRDYPRAVVEDEKGAVKYYDGVLVDITERKRAEQQVAESEARLRAVTENTVDLIEILDAGGIVRYASGSIEEVTGFNEQQVIGYSAFERVHPDDRSGLQAAFEESLQHPGRVVEVDYRHQHANGQWCYLSVRGRNLFDQPGVGGILCNIRDVTEKKKFEKALVEAKEEAEELARLKSVFLANMSHEIRTPLTGILGFADVLAEEVEGEHREFVELIRQGGQRLSETLNSVLDLARLEAGAFEPEMEVLQVDTVAHEVVQLFEQQAIEKGLELRAELPETPLYVRADEAGLGRILSNLLSNALKFTEDGRVTVRVCLEGEDVLLEVEDTGIGMRESFLSHVFEEFRQESAGFDCNHEGTGLGLTITRRLVELMGGTISVESEKGAGSIFAVALPRVSKDVGEERDRKSSPRLPQAGGGRLRVLVVEDNRNTRLLLERQLRAGWEVHATADAEEGLEAAREETFDMMLIDVNLGSGMDGTELLRTLRGDERHAHTSIVALTAYAMPGDRERFLEAGFDGYLAKPFTRKDLYDTLRTHRPD